MKELLRQALLFDFYQELLTDKQREICRMHLQEDWSLGEIAEALGISRQGVSDAIKHGLLAMEKAESKLHMAEKMWNLRKDIETLEELVEAGASAQDLKGQIERLREETFPAESFPKEALSESGFPEYRE